MKIFQVRLIQTSYLDVQVEAEDIDEANDIIAHRIDEGHYDFNEGDSTVDIDVMDEYYDLDEDEDVDEE